MSDTPEDKDKVNLVQIQAGAAAAEELDRQIQNAIDERKKMAVGPQAKEMELMAELFITVWRYKALPKELREKTEEIMTLFNMMPPEDK